MHTILRPGEPFGVAPASLPGAVSLTSALTLSKAMAGDPSMLKVSDQNQGPTRQNERGKKEPQAVTIDQHVTTS